MNQLCYNELSQGVIKMNQKFDQILQRRNNGSMKWEDAYIQKRFQIEVNHDTEIFPLFIADMDYALDEKIKKEMLKLYTQPDLGYFHIQDSFYESIVNWYDHIHHITISKDWIIPSIGTITSLNLACDMLARDQEIIIMPPVYGPFQNCSRVGKTISLPLICQNNRYYIDFENLEQILKTHHVRVLMLCHPHNPGGRMWSQDELQQLVDLCKLYQVIILVDEIHSDFNLTNQDFISMIEFSHQYDQIMVSASPNKTFNISGLSTSYMLCASPILKQQYIDYLNHLHIGCNRVGISMIELVYTYGEEWYHELIDYIRINVNMVIKTLEQAELKVMEPDCGYLVWVYLPHIENVDQFVLDLAKETHVLVETGSRFLSHYDGFIRINTATSYALLSEAMKRLVEFYKNYTKKIDD